MGTYIRLLRLKDHFLPVSAALYAAIFLHSFEIHMLIWTFSVFWISVTAFIINGMTDRLDTDKYSWNPIHLNTRRSLYTQIVWGMFWAATIIGLFLSYYSGYLWWGITMWLLGMLYSWKPVRFKRYAVLDIVVQIVAAYGIPFLAPVWGNAHIYVIFAILIVISMMLVSVAFPYEIADYKADVKAGLAGTHVILGVRGSVWFGFVLGIIAAILLLLFPFYRWFGWGSLLFVFQPVALVNYVRWLQEDTEDKILRSIQRYSSILRPVGAYFPLYLFLIWRFL